MLVSKDLALLSNHYRYYPYHYAPFLSDVRNVSSLTLTFDLGKPFMPFEQLLGVLPSASKELLPQCYQVPHTLPVPVMSVFVRNSPSFTDFFTASDDITGLTHCWVLPTRLQNGPERQTAGVGSRGAHPVHRRGALNICITVFLPITAVMEVQFRDMICVCIQKCLLAAMETYSHKLAPSEKARNRHTECAVYCFDKELDYVYNSPLPQLFPNIVHCRVRYVLSVVESACHCILHPLTG